VVRAIKNRETEFSFSSVPTVQGISSFFNIHRRMVEILWKWAH
jgi:hypothetical protein